jgi:hypothetical protein
MTIAHGPDPERSTEPLDQGFWLIGFREVGEHAPEHLPDRGIEAWRKAERMLQLRPWNARLRTLTVRS